MRRQRLTHYSTDGRRPALQKFMTKKNWLLLATFAALAVVYVVCFTDWFKPKTVQIFHTIRTAHFRRAKAGAGPSLIFGINQKLKLTEIKVVPAAEFKTNENTLPLWHIVSDSNSVPVSSFAYGKPIRGMRPAVKGASPQPLETNITYLLIVTAGNIRGEHDFELK